MAKVYLLRHGETAWNRDGNRYAGRTDVPLSDFGREQARQVAGALASIPFTAVYSSTLQRSFETAEIVAAGRRLPITAVQDLMEIDFGAWEGLTRAEIEREHLTSWTAWSQNPSSSRAGGTGETGLEAYARVSNFVRTAFQSDEKVLVVGHNTLNRLLIAGSLGMPLRNYSLIVQSNAGISELELVAGNFRWQRINQSPMDDV